MTIGRSNQDKNWDSFAVLIYILFSIERSHMLPQISRILYIYSFNKHLLIIYCNPGTSLNCVELSPYMVPSASALS